MKKYGIVIPTYNNSTYTIACLASIKKYTNNYEIVWVDDASAEDEYHKVKTYLEKEQIPVKIIKKEKNKGFIASVNSGLEYIMDETDIEYIVIQNNDTIVCENWLKNMASVMQRDDTIGIVGPLTGGFFDVQMVERLSAYYEDFPKRIKYEYDKMDISSFINFLDKNFNDDYLKIFERVAFFSVLIRRQVFEDIGFLATEYGHGYWDDDDFCERALRFGWDIAIAYGVFVRHAIGKSFEKKIGKDEWEQQKLVISKKNKEIFQKKFDYGKYERNISDINDKRVLQIIAERRRIALYDCKRQCDAEKAQMRESKFWKMREKYMKLMGKK